MEYDDVQSSGSISVWTKDIKTDDYSLAEIQSFGLLDDVPDKAWQMLQTRVRNRVNYLHPNNPYSNSYLLNVEPHRWYQDNFEPDFTCLHEEILGGLGDGAKWVCNPRKLKELAIKRESEKKEACLIYSFGIMGDFDFESDIAALLDGAPCEIHVFDMKDYESKIPTEYKHMIHYHKWGLKGSREQSQLLQDGLNSTNPDGSAVYTFHTLQETIDILGHNNRIIDVFKIDCEGCEWDTYEDWLSSNVDIRQIQVQVNSVHKNVINFFETLQKAGYVTFHKEANTIEQGRCYEYAFLKLDEAFFASA